VDMRFETLGQARARLRMRTRLVVPAWLNGLAPLAESEFGGAGLCGLGLGISSATLYIPTVVDISISVLPHPGLTRLTCGAVVEMIDGKCLRRQKKVEH
jgi:hypothetical protein